MSSVSSRPSASAVVGGAHLRGSFAAATGENRRGSNSRSHSIEITAGGAGVVPNSLEELLKRSTVFHTQQTAAPAQSQPQPQEDFAPIFTDGSSLDAGDSQFAFNNGAKFGPGGNSACEESADQLQEEINILQHALINRFRGPQKAVSGCQFRVSNPQKFNKCEQCDARDKALYKAKEMIRRLKAGQDRSQTTKEIVRRPAEDQEALNRIVSERDDLLKRCGALCIEVQRLTTALSETPAIPAPSPKSPGVAKADLEQQIQKLLSQNMMLSGVIKDLSDQKDTLQVRNLSLDTQLEDRAKAHSELQEKHSKMAQTHENEIHSFNLQLKNERNEHDEAMRAQRERNEAGMAPLLSSALEAEQVIKNLRSEIAVSSEDLESARMGLFEEKKASLLVSQENQTQATRIKELQEQIENMTRQKKITDNEIEFQKDMIDKLRKQAEEMVNEREKVLQTAISSSVRLCIVAPTVNVHVADKKLAFRTNVPVGELKAFLETEILSKYTFLFRQQNEESSPDANTNLQVFMQKALAEMQSVIESHIYSAMGTNPPA